jgi:hypothetical protein
MIDDIASAIADASVDETSKSQLLTCLPTLAEAVASWGGVGTAGALVIAASTSKGAIVLHVENGWLEIDEAEVATLDKGGVALAIYRAIESPIFAG